MTPRQPLLTDLYQLTMACGYWKAGERAEAVFHLSFRKPPFGGGYTVAAASPPLTSRELRFQADDLAYLAADRQRRGALFARSSSTTSARCASP